jgi:hypothetical protein
MVVVAVAAAAVAVAVAVVVKIIYKLYIISVYPSFHLSYQSLCVSVHLLSQSDVLCPIIVSVEGCCT